MPQGQVVHSAAKVCRGLYIQLLNLYAPAWGYGGPARLMFDYARWLAPSYDVLAFTGDLHHDLGPISESRKIIDGIRVSRYRLFFPRLVRKSIYLHSPRLFFDIARKIRSSHGRVVLHLGELRGLLPLYSILLKRCFPQKVVLVHSAFGMLHNKENARRKFYDRLFMQSFFSLVDLGLAQNEHERNMYHELGRAYGCDTRVALFPLHAERPPSSADWFEEQGKNVSVVAEMRMQYGLPPDTAIFLFLGRLHPAKGILRTIDAFVSFVRSSGKRSLLLLVGRDDGFQEQAERYIAERQISDKVRIVSNVYENRFDYYFMADVFLGFPTIFEETMLASVEALACGTPVLVSREAEIPYVEAKRAGRVIDFDVQHAAECMVAMFGDLCAYQRNARRVSQLYFNCATAVIRLHTILEKALCGDLASVGDDYEACSLAEASTSNQQSVADSLLQSRL